MTFRLKAQAKWIISILSYQWCHPANLKISMTPLHDDFDPVNEKISMTTLHDDINPVNEKICMTTLHDDSNFKNEKIIARS